MILANNSCRKIMFFGKMTEFKKMREKKQPFFLSLRFLQVKV